MVVTLPGHDDEEVEPVPRIGEVRLLANESHRRDFDEHFDGEEDEDGVVERFQYPAARGDTRYVGARLEHSERDAVEQDDSYADPLEPRSSHQQSRTITAKIYSWSFLNRNYKQLLPGTANLVLRPTAGCCHLANEKKHCSKHNTSGQRNNKMKINVALQCSENFGHFYIDSISHQLAPNS